MWYGISMIFNIAAADDDDDDDDDDDTTWYCTITLLCSVHISYMDADSPPKKWSKKKNLRPS